MVRPHDSLHVLSLDQKMIALRRFGGFLKKTFKNKSHNWCFTKFFSETQVANDHIDLKQDLQLKEPIDLPLDTIPH